MRKSHSHIPVRRIILGTVLIGLGVLPVILLICLWQIPLLLLPTWFVEHPTHPSDRQLELAVEELAKRDFQPGMHFDVALPPPLRPMTKRGTVDLFKTTDGRTIVLFKTSIGWKENYHGIIFSDAPLKPEEVRTDPGGRPVSIMLDGMYSFIKKRINNRHYEVFFDLG